ncbi:MAG: hypothetical protein MHPSP_002933, partial [Paramarteilia canceri]
MSAVATTNESFHKPGIEEIYNSSDAEIRLKTFKLTLYDNDIYENSVVDCISGSPTLLWSNLKRVYGRAIQLCYSQGIHHT